MKPIRNATKRPTKIPEPSRRADTRKRLSLYDRAEAAERKLFDAQAVEAAARKFWEQAQADASRAQVELDTARDRLFAYNDKRSRAIGERVNKQYAARARKPNTKTLTAIKAAKAGKVTGTTLDDLSR